MDIKEIESINKEENNIITNNLKNISTPTKSNNSKQNEKILKLNQKQKNNDENDIRIIKDKKESKSLNKNNFSGNLFNNLLMNSTFKKFLKYKLKYEMDNEKDIPKEFIENLSQREESKSQKKNVIKNIKKNDNKNNIKSKDKNDISFINYSYFYNEDKDKKKIIKYNKIYRRKNNNYLDQNDEYINSPKKTDNYTNEIKTNFNNRYTQKSLDNDNNNNNWTSINQRKSNIRSYDYGSFDSNDLIMKNQELYQRIIELQKEITLSKNEINLKDEELKKYFSTYDKIALENNLNKEKIEDLKKELKYQKTSMNEKLLKITELENINDTLKKEMNKLQKNFETEASTNKETKQNYDIIKTSYNDIKNQYDLLNLKYQTLTDENFNFKRDKALYEKQIKTKNEMIESLLENNSSIKNISDKLNIIEEKNNIKSNHELFLDYLKDKNMIIDEKKENEKRDDDKDKEIDNGMKKDNKDDKKENENKNENKKELDYHKFDNLPYPELQSKRDELIQERRITNNIYCKIPIKSTYKIQIDKRNELEKRLEEINSDLVIIKSRMKNLKS